MPYPNYFNPVLNNNMSPQMIGNQYLPHMQIIKVNGEAGAKNLRMSPNSSMLVLDETASVVVAAIICNVQSVLSTPW